MSNVQKQTHSLIKSLIRQHAETYPAGKDKAARYDELCAALLAAFGKKSMSEFTIYDVKNVQNWLSQDTDPAIIKDIRASRERLRLKWTGVYEYMEEVKRLYNLSTPIVRALVKQANPAGALILDPAVSLLVDHGLMGIVRTLDDIHGKADYIAAGLLNLAQCLGLGKEDEAGAEDEPEAEAVAVADEAEGGAA